ncbi:MAG: hypothetical protein E7641_06595 [Ruminococcaceae bacterium]|nr:hypothetical protein [Oscillospiraceae bacterium]
MINFKIVNKGMGELSYSVLLHTAKRILEQRELALTEGDADYTVEVSVDSSLLNDRYIIEKTEKGARISAANDCSVHGAFGKLLFDSTFDGRGGFIPAESGVFDHTPAKKLRGMYFATHNYNFYHVAPMEEIFEVIEDLGLRGCNCIEVWVDLYHYESMQSPEAQEFVQRLRTMLKYANDIGMGISFTMNANEALYNSPEELRAEWWEQGRYFKKPVAHYHNEICPSKKGGIEKIIADRRAMLECFKDLRIDYIVYWPYDQGGCTCSECQPWGSNGFLKLFPHFKALVHELLPNTKVVVSTWYFDKFVDGEWDEFYERLDDEMFDDIEYLMVFFSAGKIPECIQKNGVPKKFKLIDFPEISMHFCKPWGGYGASVLTSYLDKTNKAAAHMYDGGFPYSEGIFEDANKFICMGTYTGLYPDAFDALRAWVKFEFCCDDEALYEAIRDTEVGLTRVMDEDSQKYLAPYRSVITDTSEVKKVYNTLSDYNMTLPEKITKARNFRMFYLRALIDFEMLKHDFKPLHSAACRIAMQEVDDISHVEERTSWAVRTPLVDKGKR